MDGAMAKRNQNTGITLLKSMLSDHNYAPARSFESVEEFEIHFCKYAMLIIDATEQSIQRPVNRNDQKDHYSGK